MYLHKYDKKKQHNIMKTTSIRWHSSTHSSNFENSLPKTQDTNFYQCGADERGHGPPVLRQGNPPLRHPVHGTAQHTATNARRYNTPNTRDAQKRTD